jgi:hypothetical protein
LKKVLSLFLVILITVCVTSCSTQTRDEVSYGDLFSKLETLSLVAARCLKDNSANSNSCRTFVKMYKSGGSEIIKQFSNRAGEFLENDLAGSLVATEQVITISNAVLFLVEHQKTHKS